MGRVTPHDVRHDSPNEGAQRSRNARPAACSICRNARIGSYLERSVQRSVRKEVHLTIRRARRPCTKNRRSTSCRPRRGHAVSSTADAVVVNLSCGEVCRSVCFFEKRLTTPASDIKLPLGVDAARCDWLQSNQQKGTSLFAITSGWPSSLSLPFRLATARSIPPVPSHCVNSPLYSIHPCGAFCRLCVRQRADTSGQTRRRQEYGPCGIYGCLDVVQVHA